MKVTGADLKARLLALDEGDSLVVNRQQWVSLGEHGFEVTNLMEPEAGIAVRDRASVEQVFQDDDVFEVLA